MHAGSIKKSNYLLNLAPVLGSLVLIIFIRHVGKTMWTSK
jgi:hypothetical protein